MDEVTGKPGARRLSQAQRRHQLLETALVIIREEGADRLTLGHLAARAGISKPVAYDHFGTRSGLLIALYKSIDIRQVDALREALATGERHLGAVVATLAAAYIHCSVDTGGEWHAVGAALAGSEDMHAVHQELLDGYVQLFASVLAPYCSLSSDDLERRCVGLVGAGEALSAAMLSGSLSEQEAADTLALLIKNGVQAGA
jgi:AcrR family transcriptional regulator